MKYQEGDKLTIKQNTTKHGFEIGEGIEVVTVSEHDYYAKSLKTHKCWWVDNDDIEEPIEKMKNEYTDIFGNDLIECQALNKALHGCADDYNQSIYDYMGKCPRTAFVVHLVNKLNEMGFEIKRK